MSGSVFLNGTTKNHNYFNKLVGYLRFFITSVYNIMLILIGQFRISGKILCLLDNNRTAMRDRP